MDDIVKESRFVSFLNRIPELSGVEKVLAKRLGRDNVLRFQDERRTSEGVYDEQDNETVAERIKVAFLWKREVGVNVIVADFCEGLVELNARRHKILFHENTDQDFINATEDLESDLQVTENSGTVDEVKPYFTVAEAKQGVWA